MDLELELAYARLRLAMAVDEWAEREHEAVHQRSNYLRRSLGQQFRFLRERLTRLPANHPHSKFRRFAAIGYTPSPSSVFSPITRTATVPPGSMVLSAAASEFLKQTMGDRRAVHALEGLAP